ncbi:MAG: HypC/HybG/HupF family hydrogenase formation chaperone [Solirubrobacteraceae bacterium]|jgi:hydrogenase maturation factor
MNDDRCITCGDTAVVATVISLDGTSAVVESDGVRTEVAIELVGGVAVGEELLCHAGVAIERVSEDLP